MTSTKVKVLKWKQYKSLVVANVGRCNAIKVNLVASHL